MSKKPKHSRIIPILFFVLLFLFPPLFQEIHVATANHSHDCTGTGNEKAVLSGYVQTCLVCDFHYTPFIHVAFVNRLTRLHYFKENIRISFPAFIPAHFTPFILLRAPPSIS